MRKFASRQQEAEAVERHRIYLGIGSNLTDRFLHLQDAINTLGRLPETSVTGVSGIYLTEPVGVTDQERFYNGVVQLESALPPKTLRSHCKEIERHLGRPERYRRWGPRVIDLDILLYDDLVMQSNLLCIPHKELANRMFVLIPLLDLADPDHPVLRRPISSLLETCPDRSVLIRIPERLSVP